MSSRNSIEPFRGVAVSLALGGLFVGAAVTQGRTQITDRKEIITKAIETHRYDIERKEPARRGTVRSEDGKVLAQSRDAYEFGIDYSKCPKSPGFFLALAEATGMSASELREPGLRGVDSRYWPDPVPADDYSAIRQVQTDWKADGISLRRIENRVFPLAEAGAGILGTMRDGKPVNGLEKSQENALSGQDGRAEGFVDRTGVFMPLRGSEIIDKINGEDITLTLNSDLQMEATQAIREAVEMRHAKSGAAVVMDPKTGRILAMANWPSYDPAGPIPMGADLNAAYMSRFEPGSTFKTLMLALALDKGVVNKDTIMHCPGSIVVAGHTIHCSHGAHGDISIGKAIAESCNVSAAHWAMDVGYDSFVDYVKKLGFMDKPDLGLPGEIRGSYNLNDANKTLQIAINGFGQSMNVPPVMLCSDFAMLANGGVRMKPQLIERVGDKQFAPVEAGRMVTQASADYVRRLMIGTIESDEGTGKKLRIPGYTLAGKTGTAQKMAGGEDKGYVSSFVGFVPAEDTKAVVLVMVNDPKVGHYGADVAGPVFVDIAKTVIRLKAIAPDITTSPVADKR